MSLVTEVGEAGDVEVAGLDVQGVEGDLQLAGGADCESLGVTHLGSGMVREHFN